MQATAPAGPVDIGVGSAPCNLQPRALKLAAHPGDRVLPVWPVPRKRNAGIARADELGEQLRALVARVDVGLVRQRLQAHDVHACTRAAPQPLDEGREERRLEVRREDIDRAQQIVREDDVVHGVVR